MNRLLLLIIAGSAFLGCCRQTHDHEIKMNAELRRQVRNDSREIFFSGECTAEVTPVVRTHLEKTGVHIQSTNGRFFTAAGTAFAIRTLAKQQNIIRLESGPKYHLKTSGEAE